MIPGEAGALVSPGDGKVTDEIHLAAAKDGQSIEVTDNDVLHHQITTFTLDKQQ